MRLTHWWILLLFPSIVLADEPLLTIQILSKYHPQSLTVETRSRIFQLAHGVPPQFEFSAPVDQPMTITVGDLQRSYRGTIQVSWSGDEYVLKNITPIEMYVAGVVVGELGSQAEPELIKAQAILARTYALKTRQRETLADLAYHQVFHGFDHYAQSIYAITRQTHDLVLMQDGRLADALYHAECGSAIYQAGEFWRVDNYQVPIELPAGMTKGQPWQVFLTEAQLSAVFPKATQLSQLRTIPMMMDLGSEQRNIETFRLMINRKYGWNTIPSNEFDIQRQSQGWLLQGHGRGHLVGLCQLQAGELAGQGLGYEQILGVFYPDLKLTSLP